MKGSIMGRNAFRDMRSNNGTQKAMEVKRIGSAFAIVIDEDTAEQMGIYDGQVIYDDPGRVLERAGKALKDAVKKG